MISRSAAVFDNLLPDNDDIRRLLAGRVGAEGVDAHSLLAKIGRDCVGALQFLPHSEDPQIARIEGEAMSELDMAALLRDLSSMPLGLRPDRDFRISVAGAGETRVALA